MATSARKVFQLDSISNDVTLTCFHPNEETILKLKGLGSTLTQDRKPFAFTSKALADVEAGTQTSEENSLLLSTAARRSTPTCTTEAVQSTLNLTIRYRPSKEIEVDNALSKLSPESQDPIPEMND